MFCFCNFREVYVRHCCSGCILLILINGQKMTLFIIYCPCLWYDMFCQIQFSGMQYNIYFSSLQLQKSFARTYMCMGVCCEVYYVWCRTSVMIITYSVCILSVMRSWDVHACRQMTSCTLYLLESQLCVLVCVSVFVLRK